MYLSQLLINVGDNPDRPRPGRLWLRNIYHVHQRLCMAFPSDWRRNNDRPFLEPFKESDFPLLRNPNGNPPEPRHSFLFRIDDLTKDDASRAVILVQSEAEPDWDYAFGLKPGLVDARTRRPIGNAGCLLAAPPQMKERNPAYAAGQELIFRIRVNLSKKAKQAKDGTALQRVPERHKGKKDNNGRDKVQGKRVSLTWDSGQEPDDVIREWFARKANIKLKGMEEKETVQAFELRSGNLLQLGWVVGYKALMSADGCDSQTSDSSVRNARRIRLRSALLEGRLKVLDAPAFSQLIVSGIGSAKAFGFGLLSVAPVRGEEPRHA